MAIKLAMLLAATFCALVYAAEEKQTGLVPHGGMAVQIVKGDGNGGLEVDQGGLDVLRELGELHVVSAVGPYHSGKSFLMNQLMASQGDAFPIGSSTKPTTDGIWFWSVPGRSPGVKHPILFVDTEG